MIKFKELVKEAGGAGDWGTDEARKKLQKDTPGQGITDIGVKNKERKESVELDELDSKTYRSYHDKATADQIKRMSKDKRSKEDQRIMRKRSLGIATAGMKQYGDKRTMSQRIRGEEVELDEEKVIKIVADHSGPRYKVGQVIKTFPETGKGLAQAMAFQATLKTKHGVHSTMVRESVELDEGTLAARDESIIDSMLSALKQKLIKDLKDGDMKDAQEVAKLVKMTIEKDYKHKGFSRLKR